MQEMEELAKSIPSEEFEKIIAGNITSLNFIICSSKTEIHKLTKLSYKSIDNILFETANILSNKFTTADKIEKWSKISTGCFQIDEITKGGIPVKGITEVFGCSGVGKTQFCLQLSIITQLPKLNGGVHKDVIYICTEDAFPSKRFKELSLIFKNKYNMVKTFDDHVYIQHMSTYGQFKHLLNNLLLNFIATHNIGLIIIDSIAGLFRSENIDVIYTDRSHELAKIVAALNSLAKKYNLGVICVNQVTEDIATTETKPCLGLAWSNLITTRFQINRYVGSQTREFQIIFSPELESTKCNFVITNDGMT